MDIAAWAPGIYPRSDDLIQATRDLERGRTTPERVAEAQSRDRAALLAAQRSAGLDLVSDGMLDWQDAFRPLVERTANLTARPLVRFLDTNTFYRSILVEGEPVLEQPLDPPDLPRGRWLATLPSPHAFAAAAAGAVGATVLAERVLAPQIEAFAAAGCATVVLWEPFLTTGDVPELERALRALPDQLPIHLWLAFTDAAPLLGPVAGLPVAGVGVDLYATALDAIPDRFPHRLLAGVVDARSSALEDPVELRGPVRALLDRAPAGVTLVPNGDLQFVPEPIAREKLARLGRARHDLQEAAA